MCYYKVIFWMILLCVSVFSLSSCVDPDAEQMVMETSAIPADGNLPADSEQPVVVEQLTDSEQPADVNSQVIISLGDKKLTMQHVEWMQPNADEATIIKIAEWWLENELLYAEAEKREVTGQPKAVFMADIMGKKAVTQQLRSQVMEAATVTDKQVRQYYNKNKDSDPRLRHDGGVSFSHIRTKTIQEAQALLERIKAGEDIRVLARKLSIYRDADRGGEVKGARDYLIKRHFGGSFLSAIHAGEENDLIGPIKVKDGYEIARIDKRVEKTVLDFEQAERYIRPRLEREEKKQAFTKLLDKLKKRSARRITRSSHFFPDKKDSDDEKSKPAATSQTEQNVQK